MQFQVSWVSPDDLAVRREVVEADDESSVRTVQTAQGRVVLEVRPYRVSGNAARAHKHAEFALLSRELRTLVRAGMTVTEAVDTLANTSTHSAGRNLLQALHANLQAGQSLSVALEQLPGVPAVLVAAVRSSERTSNLPEALDDYLRYDEVVQQLRRKIISAAIYPALVASLGVGISLFLLLVVMPSFARMYENLRGQAVGITSLVIDFSLWITSHRQAAFAAIALAGGGVAVVLRRGAAKRLVTRLAFASPLVRVRLEDFQLAMLYQALALLLKGGYPLTQALEIAGQASLSTELRNALRRATVQIQEGRSVSQSLSEATLCDAVGRRLMAAAERNGDFHLAAQVVSRLHGDRFDLFVERVARIAEPLLLLAVAVMVGTIVVAMYMPVFDMAARLR